MNRKPWGEIVAEKRSEIATLKDQAAKGGMLQNTATRIARLEGWLDGANAGLVHARRLTRPGSDIDSQTRAAEGYQP